MGGYIFALVLLCFALGVANEVIERGGMSLREDQAPVVVGQLKDVEIIPRWAGDNSLLVLKDETRIQVRGVYSVYRPGMDVATVENKKGVLYCLAELCRYRRD